MPLPEPFEGLVIRYGYLWKRLQLAGLDEGKDRPCMILSLIRQPDVQNPRVIVLPITHTRPDPELDQEGIAVPPVTARRLGLDDEQFWVIVSECNRFTWPGPDVQPVSSSRQDYGPVPPRLYRACRDRFVERARERRVTAVGRTDTEH